VLAGKDTARDPCAEAVRTAETIEPAALLGCKFLFDCGLDSAYFDVEVDVRAVELTQGFTGVCHASLADKPPGGFRSEEEADGEEGGKEELDGEGAAVSPSVGALTEAFDDTV